MTAPTPEAVLNRAHIGNGFYDWAVDGGTITLRRHQLEPALLSAWDAWDPNWPAQVESWFDLGDDHDDHPSLSARDRNPSLR
jgi:hypothetical protein